MKCFNDCSNELLKLPFDEGFILDGIALLGDVVKARFCRGSTRVVFLYAIFSFYFFVCVGILFVSLALMSTMSRLLRGKHFVYSV